jgi:hypothetical protein
LQSQEPSAHNWYWLAPFAAAVLAIATFIFTHRH